jgi:hypothetical protein
MGSNHSQVQESLIQEIREKKRISLDLESSTLIGAGGGEGDFENVDLQGVNAVEDRIKIETIFYTTSNLGKIPYKTHTLKQELLDLKALLVDPQNHQQYKYNLDDLRRWIPRECARRESMFGGFCGYLTKEPTYVNCLKQVLYQLPYYGPDST